MKKHLNVGLCLIFLNSGALMATEKASAKIVGYETTMVRLSFRNKKLNTYISKSYTENMTTDHHSNGQNALFNSFIKARIRCYQDKSWFQRCLRVSTRPLYENEGFSSPLNTKKVKARQLMDKAEKIIAEFNCTHSIFKKGPYSTPESEDSASSLQKIQEKQRFNVEEAVRRELDLAGSNHLSMNHPSVKKIVEKYRKEASYFDNDEAINNCKDHSQAKINCEEILRIRKQDPDLKNEYKIAYCSMDREAIVADFTNRAEQSRLLFEQAEELAVEYDKDALKERQREMDFYYNNSRVKVIKH